MSVRMDSLPDPLVSAGGDRIVTKEHWEHIRRDEIVELFREHVYGREPLQRPEYMKFSIATEESALEGRAVRKEVTITFEGPGGKGVIPVTLFLPADSKGAVPVCLLINNRGRMDPLGLSGFWPADYIVSRGYAAAVYQVEDLDPDYDDEFRNGVHALFDPPGQPRPANAWGTIAAWAWGASRIMDYFEADPAIDAARVMLVGHSRGGKTALWAGALDNRFAMVVSNNSGCTGAAVSRGKAGERVHDINAKFPHWFADNYKSYDNKENELPIDQHMLLSLIAPRLLYVASASEDQWADPESEFLALALAQKVYRLYGQEGLEGLEGLDDQEQAEVQERERGQEQEQDVRVGAAPLPQPESPIHGDRLGYHLRTGKHDLQLYDWSCFLDFADRNL